MPRTCSNVTMGRGVLALAVATACLLGATPVGAQDRVALGTPPAPGQSQRVRVTQTSHMTMAPQGTPPPGFPADGLQVESTNAIVVRHDVGLPDAAGRVRYDVTYESMSQSVRMQGKEIPLPASPAGDLTGKTFTVWVDAANQIADVTVPEGLPLTSAQAKQMLTPSFSAVPRQDMAIGDIATRPLSLTIPMPGPAGGGGATMTGTTRTTLLGVDGTGTDRIARLGVAFDGELNVAATAETRPGLVMSTKGKGAMQVNLLSGFVVASQSDHTIDGTMRLPGAADGAGSLTMRGTVSVTTERLPQ